MASKLPRYAETVLDRTEAPPSTRQSQESHYQYQVPEKSPSGPPSISSLSGHEINQQAGGFTVVGDN